MHVVQVNIDKLCFKKKITGPFSFMQICESKICLCGVEFMWNMQLHYSFLILSEGRKTKWHHLTRCKTLKCTCVPHFFSVFLFFFFSFFWKTLKNYTNLFMLSFFFSFSIFFFFVDVCIASQSIIFCIFCKYIFSLLFLR